MATERLNTSTGPLLSIGVWGRGLGVSALEDTSATRSVATKTMAGMVAHHGPSNNGTYLMGSLSSFSLGGRFDATDFSFRGYDIPAGTAVGVNPLFTHHMPDIWPEPEKFDPLRFTDEAQRSRHRFAWVPYGGGAHMCLGLHFAYMQAKCFARHFLQNLEVSLEPGYRPDWQMWPIPKPRDGLRVVLKPV
jgi:hypothetical protein